MTRAAMYARYSSENQKESSIDDQFRNCEQYARREGWEIVERYSDKAISGSTNLRPAYQQMLKDARAKHFDVLLVDDFSRLSRDQIESEQVRRQMIYWGCRLIGVSDGIDTSSKGHKLQAGMKNLMNDIFLDDLKDKTKRGMIGKVLKGFHGGGRTYGYKLVAVIDPSHKDPYGQPARIGTRLEKDPEQEKWVRWIFEQYAEGMSPVKITDELNRQHVPPPGMHYKRRSSKPPSWCVSALYGNPRYQLGLLNNARYRGEIAWGRTFWTRDPDTKRKRRVSVEEAQWIRQPAEHLRIISNELWARAKARQQDTHKASAAIRTALHANARTGRAPKYLFSGLLVCGLCGHRFVIADPNRYACGGWKARGLSVCGNTIKASRHLIETRLLQAIAKDLFTEAGQALFIKETTRLLTEQRRTPKPDTQAATQRLENVEQEISHIMDAIKAGIITPSTKAALEKAEAERATLIETVQGPPPKDAKVSTFLPSAVSRLKALVDDLGNVTQLQVDRARAVLRTMLGKEIVLHPTADCETRYLTAELTGDYAGLLRLETGQNKSGGGQGS